MKMGNSFNHRMKMERQTGKLAIVFFCVTVWLLFLPLGPGAETAEINALVDDFFAESHPPGVQVAIMHKNDSHPFTISKGKACLSNSVPMTDDHIFKIGSVTKLFTATRIHMLIQEKKLTYETPISTFFPNFPNGNKIHIRHLLTHTSGLVEMLAIKDVFENLSKPLTPETIMADVAETALLFEPGTEQKYCNSGYLILGRVVEKLTGQPFEAEIKKSVLIPLGMTHTRQGDDLVLLEKEVAGYNLNREGQVIKAAIASMSPPFGTGNFISTAGDIVRFVHLGRLLKDNFIDRPGNGFWILENGKPASSPHKYKKLAFEMGWHDGFAMLRFTTPVDMTLVGKAGMFPGFCAWFLHDAKTGYGVAITVNDETKTMDALELAVNIFLNKRRQ